MSLEPLPVPTIRLASPDVGDEEIDAVTRVLRGHVLTNGPETQAFEQDFAAYHQAEHGVAFSNGTVALTAIYSALGVGAGDEVVVPSLTFVSSATSIVLAGATPVFADVHADTFNIDPADVAKRLTPRTKAILAVHYGGQPADLSELQALADDAGIVLLEDAAEAHGARYKGRPVGALARAGMFSFTPTKNITTGEGGMVLTNDGDLASRLRLLRNHGQTALYQHELLGNNWRLSEMQSAMGRAQLAKLDAILARKHAIASSFDQRFAALAGVQPPAVRSDRTHVHMLYTLKFSGGHFVRESVAAMASTRGVETRIYFPPAHRQPIFAGVETDLPVTDDLSGRILSVPVHSKLEMNDIGTITSAVAAGVEHAARSVTA